MEEMIKNRCVLDIPYPKLAVSGKNLRYAALLSQDYAGNQSELTAVTQYLYQHFISEENKTLADTLSCIAKTEMLHMEMLGHLITMLGGDPQIRGMKNNSYVYWDGNFPFYGQNIRLFLQEDIKAERTAVFNYRTRIRQINDVPIDRVLERIILDEQNHIKIFRRLLEEI